MTLQQLIHIGAPNCNYEKEAIRIVRMRGSDEALRYLIQAGGNKELLKTAMGLGTKNLREEIPRE